MAYNKETGMYEGYIYKIWNEVNDKVYIGQTITTVNARWSGHKSASRLANINKDAGPLHRAMNKYGTNSFYVCELEKIVANTKKDLQTKLNILEINYIQKHNSVSPNGYNLDKGGNSNSVSIIQLDVYDLELNYISSYENVEQASICTGVGIDAIRNCYNHKSTKAGKYVFVKKGETPFAPKITTKKVKQYTLDGIYLQTYNSPKDASIALNLDSGNIINCCNNRGYHSVGGFIWRYNDEAPVTENKFFQSKVDCYDLNKKYIKTYDSIKEATKELNVSQSQISSVCLNKVKTAGGYIWRYHNDDISTYKFGEYKDNKTIIFLYDKNMNFIKKFISIGEAANELKISKGTISKYSLTNLPYNDYIFYRKEVV